MRPAPKKYPDIVEEIVAAAMVVALLIGGLAISL